MTAPKERPILFSGPMVRALLDGRKTQTRRVIKPQPDSVKNFGRAVPYRRASPPQDMPSAKYEVPIVYPYGAPGDCLWVKETWGLNDTIYGGDQPIPKARPADLPPEGLVFFATEDDTEIRNELRWRPSIHMPRWASRLTLEITEVRVERLQEVSQADAAAEGLMTWLGRDCDGDPRLDGRMYDFTAWGWQQPTHESDGFMSAYAAYRDLWKHINGPDSWDANPWVWAVSFRVLDQGA